MPKQLSDGDTTGTTLGQSATDKLGFFGLATPVVRVTVGAALATTATTVTTPFGFSTQAQGDAITTRLNEIRAALVAYGIIA